MYDGGLLLKKSSKLRKHKYTYILKSLILIVIAIYTARLVETRRWQGARKLEILFSK